MAISTSSALGARRATVSGTRPLSGDRAAGGGQRPRRRGREQQLAVSGDAGSMGLGKGRGYGASWGHSATLPPRPRRVASRLPASGSVRFRRRWPRAGPDRLDHSEKDPGYRAARKPGEFQCRDLVGGGNAGAAVDSHRHAVPARPAPRTGGAGPAAGRKRPASSRFSAVGALTAPGMWPARGSTGSTSPRYRSPARASSSSPRSGQSAAARGVEHGHGTVASVHVARDRLPPGPLRAAARPAARRPGRRRAGKRCGIRRRGASTTRGPRPCCRCHRRQPPRRLR